MRVNWEDEKNSFKLQNHLLEAEYVKACALLSQAKEMALSLKKGQLFLESANTMSRAMEEHSAYQDIYLDHIKDCLEGAVVGVLGRGFGEEWFLQNVLEMCTQFAEKGYDIGKRYLRYVGYIFCESIGLMPTDTLKREFGFKTLAILQTAHRLGAKDTVPLIEKCVCENLAQFVFDGICGFKEVEHPLKFLVLNGSFKAAELLAELSCITDPVWDKEIEDILERDPRGFKKQSSVSDLNMAAQEIQHIIKQTLGADVTKFILQLGFLVQNDDNEGTEFGFDEPENPFLN